MKLSDSSAKMRLAIEKALETHQIKREEYDMIIHLATEDGFIDAQEKAMLSQLHDMIEDRSVKIIP